MSAAGPAIADHETLARPTPEAPLDRLAREAVQGARASMRGRRPELVDAAVRSALRETIFRYELVMRIYVTTHELLDREELLATLFASQIALLLFERHGKRPLDESVVRRLEQCRQLTRLRERRGPRSSPATSTATPLSSRTSLPPFEAQLKDSEVVAAMAIRPAGLAGVDPGPIDDPEAVSVRVGLLVADLVEPAKSEAADKCGEGRQAFDIAAGWVRSKLNQPTPGNDDLAALSPFSRL